MSFLRNLRWLLRHPDALAPLAGGARFPDLVLAEDLRRLGIPLPPSESAGLAAAHLSIKVVTLLRERFGAAPPRTFLDVGAAHGGYSLAATLAFPGVRVFAFEPLPDVFEALAATAASREGIAIFPWALGAKDGRETIHRSRSTGSSSILPMKELHEAHFPGTGTVGEVQVEVRTLDGLVAGGEVEITRPSLMKVDVQGFEDRVLAGAEQALSQVDTLIVELSLQELYEGQLLLPELRAGIEDHGFAFEGHFTEGRSTTTGELLQVDALFARR